MKYPQLMLGDCLELMSAIPEGSVDLILADLPYTTTHEIPIPLELLWSHYWRVLKANGVVLLFGSEPFSTVLRMSQLKNFRYDWIWDKKIPSGMSYARFQPMRRHELISVFYRNTPDYFPQKTIREKPIKSGGQGHLTTLEKYRIAGFTREYDDKNPTSIISFGKVRRGRLHPSQKPVPLLEYLIRTYTSDDGIVLDNVMGSGSTGLACLNTGRRFIGMEKDETYYGIAEQRILGSEVLIDNNYETWCDGL